MGLRCLLGHEFSEPEIEREREETGEEAVTTVREVKTCARCGETRIVSENTEVTTIEQLADQATTAAASADPTPADSTPADPTPTDSALTDPTPADPTPTDRPDSADAGASSTGSADRRSGYSADDRDADPNTARAFDDPDTDHAEDLHETARSRGGGWEPPNAREARRVRAPPGREIRVGRGWAQDPRGGQPPLFPYDTASTRQRWSEQRSRAAWPGLSRPSSRGRW